MNHRVLRPVAMQELESLYCDACFTVAGLLNAAGHGERNNDLDSGGVVLPVAVAKRTVTDMFWTKHQRYDMSGRVRVLGWR